MLLGDLETAAKSLAHAIELETSNSAVKYSFERALLSVMDNDPVCSMKVATREKVEVVPRELSAIPAPTPLPSELQIELRPFIKYDREVAKLGCP